METTIRRLVVEGDRLTGVQLADGTYWPAPPYSLAPHFVANQQMSRHSERRQTLRHAPHESISVQAGAPAFRACGRLAMSLTSLASSSTLRPQVPARDQRRPG